MDEDGDDKDDSKRRTRNLSEKKRRDQFNMLVTELSTLITSNNRKMDKSTVLKSTISFLKNHNEVKVRSRAHDVHENWKPTFLTNEEFTYLVLEALEGFVMVFSASGRIYYASESIFSLLGHKSADIVNKSIFDLTFEEDRHNLYNLLQRNASAVEQMSNSANENEMIRFQIHLRRGTLDFRKDVSYDLIQFYGHFRSSHEQVDDERDMMCYQQDVESRLLFVCIGRLHNPQLIQDVSLVDSSRNEFTSRHSLEWKFLFLDHRAPPIIGYLPFEVLGTSGYDYYHFDDLEKVVTCHEALMQKGELTSCHYRFLTKGQQWIWLQTRFYISYHQWNSKPEFVVCTHRVVSVADVVKTMKEEEVENDANVSETAANLNKIKEAHEDPIPPMSPSYVSEAASDVYPNSYQPISQDVVPSDDSPSPLLTLSSETLLQECTMSARCTEGLLLATTLPNTESLEALLTDDTPLDKSPPSVAPPPYVSPTNVSLPMISPSFTAETVSDNFGNSFQIVSQNTLMSSSSPMRPLALSPLYMSDCSDSIHNSYSSFSKTSFKSSVSEVMPSSFEVTFGNSYLQPASVKSVSAGSTTTVGVGHGAASSASWTRAHTCYTGAGSDAGSQSGESRSSQRNCERESNKPTETSLAPQHGMGAQYLEQSSPYVSRVAVPAGMMPVSTMPVVVTSDQAEMQEQLQRKHEELQQMILRQQEELRQVKEQLMLARLGMLQPMGNVPNQLMAIGPPEEMQNQQRMTPQLGYTNAVIPGTAMVGYPQHVPALQPPPLQQSPQPPQPQPPPLTHPPHPSHPPHPPHQPHQLHSPNQPLPPNPTHPPHSSEPHQHMPQ